MVIEIVILAMIAAFLGMRLYSVLGRRAEGEEERIPRQFDSGDVPANDAEDVVRQMPLPQRKPQLENVLPAVERGLTDIAATDRNFDLLGFLEGAKGAYGMVLEAFWQGDKETLGELCDDDVFASFSGAIDAREAAGEELENKLIRIEETTIHSAMLDGKMARIAVLFVADIYSVTRDKDGNIIAGSTDDAVESRDIWTFSRDMSADGPDWVLDETDEG